MNRVELLARRGDVDLWSETFGNRGNEPVLLIAGANTPGSMWPDALVEQLVGSGYWVIRYDHRDTGRSTTRPFESFPYRIEDLASDALAVLDAHAIDRAHIVGLSMGGVIGQLLALDSPERLRSLTVMMTAALDVDFAASYARAMDGHETTADLPGPDPQVVKQLGMMFTPGQTIEDEVKRRVDVWRVLNGSESAFDAREFGERERKAIALAGSLTPPTGHAFATSVKTKRGAELRHLSVPTLVIQGGQDPLNPPPHGRHLADLISGSDFLQIDDMGHALPSSVFDMVSAALSAQFEKTRTKQ